MNQANDNTFKVLRLKDVLHKLSISRSTLYDWMDDESPRFDSKFPKPIKLGATSIGWIEGEINDWLYSRMLNR
jgi:prophage regulatory protein